MVFCQDVSNPEGPVSLPDGSWIITEMDRGVISHISADGKKLRIIAETGRPNGLAVDGNGNLWVAESKFPSLLKLTLPDRITTISTGNPGLPFLWPNDLCFGPDGAIYMTDSGILLDEMEGVDSPESIYKLPIDGRVFRVDPKTGVCDLLDRGLRFANGIAIGPDRETLYVSETLTGNIYRYRFAGHRLPSQRELFGNVMLRPPAEYGMVAGPDGMAFDNEGNLLVGVLRQGDITVLGSNGSVKDHLSIPGTFPTNLAFDQSGKPQILITEGSGNQLLKLEVSAGGLALHAT